MTFHWWYIPVGLILLFMIFGKGKGGIVAERLTANIKVVDQRFEGSRTRAKYSTFKNGSPDHLEIEIDKLSIPAGEELEIQINKKTLAKVTVERDKEAEFDHWSDEDVYFPVIKPGDELVITYQGVVVLIGRF